MKDFSLICILFPCLAAYLNYSAWNSDISHTFRKNKKSWLNNKRHSVPQGQTSRLSNKWGKQTCQSELTLLLFCCATILLNDLADGRGWFWARSSSYPAAPHTNCSWRPFLMVSDDHFVPRELDWQSLASWSLLNTRDTFSSSCFLCLRTFHFSRLSLARVCCSLKILFVKAFIFSAQFTTAHDACGTFTVVVRLPPVKSKKAWLSLQSGISCCPSSIQKRQKWKTDHKHQLNTWHTPIN